MKLGIYSVQDNLTGFINLSTDKNDASAVRSFRYACSNPESLFFTNPADYALFKLGEFETDTGVCDVFPPVKLCGAADFGKE